MEKFIISPSDSEFDSESESESDSTTLFKRKIKFYFTLK